MPKIVDTPESGHFSELFYGDVAGGDGEARPPGEVGGQRRRLETGGDLPVLSRFAIGK